MESEQIQDRDPFPQTTHRTHEAGDPASARKHHDVTETIIMSQVPGSEEVEEKEDLSLSRDLALLFVMKEHIWDGSSSFVEKDTSEEQERGLRDLENWTKHNLNRGQPSLKESRESSLNSFDGEFATHSSSSFQSFLSDTTSPALTSPRKVRAGQMQSQVHDVSFGPSPTRCDMLPQTRHEESATTDSLPGQEDSVHESPLVIHNISRCHKSADFSKSRSAEDHSWTLETRQEENGNLYEGMDVVVRTNERKEASQRLSNRSSEEEELNLDGAQRNVLFQVSSKEVENRSNVDDEIGDLEKNILSCLVLHLQEEEESDVEVSNSLSLKENIPANCNISSLNCDESESDQKQLSTAMRPQFAEMEALELAGSEEKREENLNGSKTKTNLEEVQLPHNDSEEQEWTVQATIPSMPIRLGQDTLSSLENSLALSGLNNNSSGEFAFSFKEVSSADHSPASACALPEPCVQTTTRMILAGFQTDSGSPETQAAIYHSSGQVEHFGIYDKESKMSCCDQDGSQTTVDVGKEDIGNENVRSADDEQVTQLFTDVALDIDTQHLHDSQPVGFSSDSDQNPVPSLRTIAAALLQEDPSEGATDGTVSYAGDESGLHLSSQLDRARCDEDSAVDSDGDGHLPAFGEDFLEDIQSSTSRILPNPSLEEGLSNIAKEMIKLSLSSWDSEQDTAENDVKSHQQLKPTMEDAGLSGKEAAAETHCVAQDSLTSESPCFSVLGKERTECDSEADSLPSCWTLFAKSTDAVHLAQPLAPLLVGDSEQTMALEYVSLLSSRQPLQFVSPPPMANAQPVPPGLNPRSPDQHLEQLPSSSQVNPLVPKSSANQTVSEPSPLAPETRVSEQLSTSERDSDPCCQVPHLVHHSRQSVPVPRHASSPILSRRSVFPSLSSSAASQRNNSKQITQPAAAGAGHNFLTQPPHSAVSRASQSSRSDSTPRKHLTVRGSPSAQWRTEASESSPLDFRTGSEEQIPPSPPTGSRWNPSSISKPGDLVLISSLDSRMEEVSGLPLAKSTPQNMCNPCPELDLSLSDLQGQLLGSDATGADSFSSLPETVSRIADMPDGRSFHHTFRPPVHRETKPTNVRQPPSLLAFTNPVHFLQLGPPSPPSVPYPGVHQAELQDPQWPKQQTRSAEDPVALLSEGPRSFRKPLDKSVGEPVCSTIHRKAVEGRHVRLEKSSSCPDKNTLGLGTKESAFGTRKQEAAVKQRAKSKDWHRHCIRKISIPTDGAIEVPAPLHSKEEAVGHKEKGNHLDFVKYGEKKTTETIENIKRRRSRLINSSKLLYQEYSDDALNKAIQSQKQIDSLSEEAEPLSPKLRRKMPISQDSYLQRLSVSSGSSLWQDIPMVRGSTMLLSMTREEQKLQEAKFELIASEASYLRSLNVAVDHFQHSPELQGVLSTQDRQWLFSRLQDVRDVSANFLFELEEKLEENMFTFNVCDVALRNAPEFRRVYLPYVTNQTYQDQTFQRLMNGVPAFQQVLEKLESDPLCQRLSLKSFLILPFQRITRLKLLLQNILKRIPPGADEEVQATQAYDALEKLIKDCNANVQRMKSTEELIHLSQNMEFECKIFPLISQSRRLVKHGELTALEYNISLKWKLTTRPIYLHLFNDYLLLSRPRENGRFIVFDYAASSHVRGEKCEMKLHGDNKNLFRLFLLQNNQGKKVEFLFRTETQSEKLRWISALMPQQPEPDLLDDSDAPQVQCVKSYKAREHDELTLEKADIIMALQQSSDGWMKGVKLSDGERGWFPLDHVEVISSKQIRQMNLKEEQRVKNAKQQVFRRR
ncbi:rho guanine nucleotide exchange factor 5-like isoform X2 [Crotalus tigris]|nr:rho guanine nucleotide exchange factor 5-like isoform X2 [Crotalus tigris]XP_039224513.1 rho guanine nucleotide exchange factor 5-like isoform X2 [Crotalus tigris]XP_039224514.1 rho guanine nucleotide exchange factor 5-like isoform X2 [Crotalus tigris]